MLLKSLVKLEEGKLNTTRYKNKKQLLKLTGKEIVQNLKN